jgi:hypothetical protein
MEPEEDTSVRLKIETIFFDQEFFGQIFCVVDLQVPAVFCLNLVSFR